MSSRASWIRHDKTYIVSLQNKNLYQISTGANLWCTLNLEWRRNMFFCWFFRNTMLRRSSDIHFEALMFVPFVFWVKIGLMLSCLKISKSSSSLQDARLHWLPLTQVSKLIAHLAQPRSSTPCIKSEARILYHSNPFLILLYQYLGHTHSAQTWSRLSSGENTVLYCPVL